MSDIATGPIPRLRLEPGPPGSRRLFLTRSLSDEEKGYEVIDGRLLPKRLTVYDSVVGNELLCALADHSRRHRVGDAVFGMLFDLPGAENFYRPEVAFVPYHRWPRTHRLPDGEAWSVVPGLVAEVAGSRRAVERTAERVGEYLRAGVVVVWVVDTTVQEVHVHTEPGVVRVLTRADELTGDPAVPGFAVPVADLFPPSAPNP